VHQGNTGLHSRIALVPTRPLELIRLERAVIGYRTPLLPPLDLAVRAGSTLGVLGPNGAGKTALLKSLLGLLPLFAGRRVLPLGRSPRVGYVPQLDDVFDSLRVRENLDMGGYLLDRRRRADRMELTLEVFPQLRSKLNRYVETLSGGERKMTAIARVLMLDPAVLILDEPTASLSRELSDVVLKEQVRALGNLGKAILLVEQKAVAALEVSDWAYMMVRGRIVMSAPAADALGSPEMRAKFLGATADAGGQA